MEDSLRRLGTDYLDVYYLHHVDHETPLEESLRALDDLVRQGKIRYAATSNYEAWRLMESLWISDAKGLARFECYQPQYSLVVRDIEAEIAPVCERHGLGVVVWSPLAGGYLTGKYQPGQVALRWVLDQGFVTSAIVGARNRGQIEETLKAVGWRLPAEMRARLDAASVLPLRYPRTMEDGMRERRTGAVRIG